MPKKVVLNFVLLFLVPENFNDLLQVYTANGFRVIAMAGKSIDSSVSWIQACKLTRDVIESDLTFYGFLIMQNTIKPETIPVIEELTKAGLRSVMVTGKIQSLRYNFDKLIFVRMLI